jgi:hypothetical protein
MEEPTAWKKLAYASGATINDEHKAWMTQLIGGPRPRLGYFLALPRVLVLFVAAAIEYFVFTGNALVWITVAGLVMFGFVAIAPITKMTARRIVHKNQLETPPS